MDIKEIHLLPKVYSEGFTWFYGKLRQLRPDLDLPNLVFRWKEKDILIGCRYIGMYLCKILSLTEMFEIRINGKMVFRDSIVTREILKNTVEYSILDWDKYPIRGRQSKNDISVSLVNVQRNLRYSEINLKDIPEDIKRSLRVKHNITIDKLKELSKKLKYKRLKLDINYKYIITKNKR